MSPYHAWPFLSDPSHPFLSAVWAVAIHAVVGVIAVAPIIWRSRHRVIYCLLAALGGFILDIDHFIAAGSLNLHTIETLSGRPDTHSILFVAALSAVTWAATRSWLAAWSVFAVNLAHLLYDAAGGNEHVVYPFTSVDGLPWLLCPLGTLALFAASTAIARATMRPAPTSAPPQLERQDAVAVG